MDTSQIFWTVIRDLDHVDCAILPQGQWRGETNKILGINMIKGRDSRGLVKTDDCANLQIGWIDPHLKTKEELV